VKRFLVLSLVAWLAACGREAAEPAAGDAPPTGAPPLVVFATSYPLAYFAERIGATAVEVVFAAPEGLDPAHWSADAETIARAQAADLLLRHGAGDPAWLDLASLHRDRVVDTTAAVRDRLIARETARHQHGPEGDHSHGEWAGTTWLDPTLAAAEAEAIAAAMIARRPDEEDAFRTNLAALRAELASIDGALARAAARLGETPLLFSHPVYDYLQARYALNGRSVAWEPDAVPNEAQWLALRALLREHPARTLLWEAEPLPETVERLTTLGIESRVYAPCANRPRRGDWLTVMHANQRALDSLARVAR
jgi:zinc transport system substrate-binding protein